MKNIKIGIDLSYKSPAISIYNFHQNYIKLYFFSIKKKHINFKKEFEKNSFKFLLKNLNNNVLNFNVKNNKYLNIYIIVQKIMDIIKENIKYDTYNINIEDYVYSSNSQSISTLCEIGGYLRILLSSLKIEFSLVHNKKLKKKTTGNGNSTKYEMFLFFEKKLKINLKEILNDKSLLINNPVEDIVDSYFLSIY